MESVTQERDGHEAQPVRGRADSGRRRSIAILREQEAGAKTAEVCCKHGIGAAAFYKWKAKFGGRDVSGAGRLKVFEIENAKLTKLLAQARRPQACARHAGADGAAARPQSALAARLRGRHPALGREGGARTRRGRRTERVAADVRVRQRHRAHQHGDPAQGASAWDRVAPHCAGPSTAERLRRILHRPAARRAPEPKPLREPRRRPADPRTLARQPRPVRPHSALGNVPPAAYAYVNASGVQPAGAQKRPRGFAPRPVAPPSPSGSNQARTLLIPG